MGVERGAHSTSGREREPWRHAAVWRVWAVQLAQGLALGLLLVGMMFLVQWVAGWLSVRGVAQPAAATVALLVGLGRSLGVALLEETIFRGLLLAYLQRPLGTPGAVVVS